MPSINFVGANSTPIASINLGINKRFLPKLAVDVTDVGQVSGILLKGTMQVGEFTASTAEGLKLTIYGDTTGVLVDTTVQFEARITNPQTVSAFITVNRSATLLDSDIRTAIIAGKLRQDLDLTIASDAVRQALNRVVNEQVNISYSMSQAKNVRTLKDYSGGTLPFPAVEVPAYTDSAALNNALVTLAPPTQQSIFNNWARIDGDSYFLPGDTYTGDAAAWYWDDTLQRFVQPNNTAKYTGFISDEAVEYYEHDATMVSSNSDDDMCGLILAFYRDPASGLNRTLDFMASQGGFPRPGSVPNPRLYVATDHANYTGVRFVDYGNTDPGGPTGSGWSSKYIRLKVVRSGDIFRLYSSAFNDTVLVPRFTLDLNNYPALSKFKGPRPYGYGTLSQAATSFYNVTFTGGQQRNNILDIANNRVYQYSNGQWVLLSGVTIHDLYGAPRLIIAAGTSQVYRLNTNGTITAL